MTKLSIDKITTRNRKYCNIRNGNYEIKNFADQYYSNKYEETNLHHTFSHYFLEFCVPYSLYYNFTRIEGANVGLTPTAILPVFSFSASLNLNLNLKRTKQSRAWFLSLVY